MLVVKNIYGYTVWELMDVQDHLMIMPKRHVESIFEFTKQEKTETIELIAEYEKKGYNTYARARDNIIKSVPHQHTHLIKTKNKHARFFIFSRKPYFIWKV
jgi:ATP adenylyltransferase